MIKLRLKKDDNNTAFFSRKKNSNWVLFLQLPKAIEPVATLMT